MRTGGTDTSHCRIAWAHSEGDGPVVLMIHGNSTCKEIFKNQIDGAIGKKFHVVAIDLPGHGASEDARDPDRTYSIPGYADAAIEVMEALGHTQYCILGWSLGGHVGLDMISKSPASIGLMITGTPPIGTEPEAMDQGFIQNVHMKSAGELHMTDQEVDAYANATAGIDTPTERFVWNAVRRTDGRARHLALGKFAAGVGANQRDIATNSPVPLAIVCGADDAFIRNDYITGLSYANLWEDQVYLLKGLDHAPFYEAPARFDPYLGRFLTDMNRDRGN